MKTEPLKIYLAGPEVFLPDSKHIGEKKKKLCEKYAFEGVFPLDGELDISNYERYEAGIAISNVNEKLISSCQAVIANITPFRGPSADVGTVYEIGFARALRLPVFAYTNTKQLLAARTISYLNLKPDGGIKCIRDEYNMEVEQFDMIDNLMIDGGIRSGGGSIVAMDAPDGELFTNLKGFEECLKLLARL